MRRWLSGVLLLALGCSACWADWSHPAAGDVRPPDGGPADSAADHDVTYPQPVSSWHKYVGAAEDEALVVSVLKGRVSSSAAFRTIYVAPPKGSSDGDGSKANPRRDLIDALKKAAAGDRIYLVPGVYKIKEIRDLFGHKQSAIVLAQSGKPGQPITVATDPDAFDPKAGKTAVIDYQYSNFYAADGTVSNARSSAIFIDGDYWTFEDLEIKRAQTRIFWVRGNHNLLKNLHLHHVDHIFWDGGTRQSPIVVTKDKLVANNQGIVTFATDEDSHNVLMDSAIHDIGIVTSQAADTMDTAGFLSSIGCVYAETRQYYDSSAAKSLPPQTKYQDLIAALKPRNGEIYLFNNLVYGCAAAGISSSTNTQGPFYYLSNVVFNSAPGSTRWYGIQVTKDYSQVRNNIVYAVGGGALTAGIKIGQSTGMVFSMFGGNHATVRNNTVIGAALGIVIVQGWGVEISRNILMAGHPYGVQRDLSFSYLSGLTAADVTPEKSCDVPTSSSIGAYFYDLNSTNPYWKGMPAYLTGSSYKRIRLFDNLYSKEPLLAPDKESGVDSECFPIYGKKFSSNYTKYTLTQIAPHFHDAAKQDYRKNLNNIGPLKTPGANLR